MTAKASQIDLLEHSEQKVKLLEHYLAAYLWIISRDGHTEEIQITDLFCGEGEFPNGKSGSPLVFGRMAARLFNETPITPRIRFRFNDVEQEKVERVHGLLKPLEDKHTPRLSLLPSNLDYGELLPLLLAEKRRMMKHTKGFYFIDPYGYSAVRPADLVQLLEGNATEVLLFQPTSFLHRFSDKGTPPALDQFMTELSGGEPWPSGMDIWGHINHTKELFRALVGDRFFVDSFTIQKDPSTVFCMYFFTPHIRGYEKMLEAKWKLNEETGLGWHYSRSDSGFDLFEKGSPQTKALERSLLNELAGNGGLTNAQIYETTLRQGFLTKHTGDLLRVWQKDGRIRVEPEDTRKGAFYLGYKEHAKEGRIIRISVITS